MDTNIIDPIIYSDSLLVVNHVNGKWKCNETLFPLLVSINIIQEDYRFRLQHVKRRYVHQADTLVNECLDRLEKNKAAVGFKTKDDKEVVTFYV